MCKSKRISLSKILSQNNFCALNSKRKLKPDSLFARIAQDSFFYDDSLKIGDKKSGIKKPIPASNARNNTKFGDLHYGNKYRLISVNITKSRSSII